MGPKKSDPETHRIWGPDMVAKVRGVEGVAFQRGAFLGSNQPWYLDAKWIRKNLAMVQIWRNSHGEWGYPGIPKNGGMVYKCL